MQQNAQVTTEQVNSVINQVKQTRDYGIFKIAAGNRGINSHHLARLKESMLEEYLFSPIIVNSQMEVIDGQHRLQAAKDLGLHINFIVCNNYGNNEIHRYNVNLKNWNFNDFVDGYIATGNDNYVKFKKFKDTYGFGNRESIVMLSGGASEKMFTKDFTKGRFKITSYEYGCKLAADINKLGKFYKGYKRRSFVFAIIYLIKEKRMDIEKLIKKLRFQSTRLVDCSTTKEYINLITEIYTYKDRK